MTKLTPEQQESREKQRQESKDKFSSNPYAPPKVKPSGDKARQP